MEIFNLSGNVAAEPFLDPEEALDLRGLTEACLDDAHGLCGVLFARARDVDQVDQHPAAFDMAEEAVAEGGGNNVVNVILTDIRALDTLGEVAVLVAVAVGVLALMGRTQVVRNREEGS